MGFGPTIVTADTAQGNELKLVRTRRSAKKDFEHQWMLVLYNKGKPIKYKGFTLRSSALRVLEEWRSLY